MRDHLTPERLAEIREQDISWMTDNEVRELLAHIDAQAETLQRVTDMLDYMRDDHDRCAISAALNGGQA